MTEPTRIWSVSYSEDPEKPIALRLELVDFLTCDQALEYAENIQDMVERYRCQQ